MRDNRICNFDFINAQMEHSKMEDMPSATNADHDGKYLRLDQTTPETLANGVPLMTTAVDGEGSGNQLVNMDFVNLAVSSLELSEFFHDDADVLGGLYFIMDESEDAAGTVVSAAVPTGSATGIFNFLTPDGKPGLDRLVEGVYDCHAHLSRSASITRDVTVHYEFYKRASIGTGGAETLLGTSEVQAITTSATEYNIHLTLAAEEMILTTDRLLIKWYATVTGGGGANPTVTMNTGDADNSHFSVNINALDLSTIFLKRDGTDAMTGNLDMGTNNITNAGTLACGTIASTDDIKIKKDKKYILNDDDGDDSYIIADATTVKIYNQGTLMATFSVVA